VPKKPIFTVALVDEEVVDLADLLAVGIVHLVAGVLIL
jgi:hypothetical protein